MGSALKPKCCTRSDFDFRRSVEESRKKTIDLNGYASQKELFYNDFVVTYTNSGSLRIGVTSKENGRKWMKLYKPTASDDNLSDIEQRMNSAYNIKAYLYKNNENDYPVLIDVDEGEFEILLSPKGDKSKYVVINSSKHNLILS